jgi:hypothetical protein
MEEEEPMGETEAAGPEAVEVEVAVAAPAGMVWSMLRDPKQIRRWHGWEYEGLDEEIRQIFIDAPRVSDADLILDTGDGRFELEEHGEQTVVRVVRSAPAGAASWEGAYDAINEGWLTFVEQLRFALERQPGRDRNTVYLAGEARDAGAGSLFDRLGLDAVEGLAVGERYHAAVATGDSLTGTVWQRQLGLTVDRWGEGLLMLSAGGQADPGQGASGAILSAFGLDDQSCEALAERWSRWWGEHYEPAPSSGGSDEAA